MKLRAAATRRVGTAGSATSGQVKTARGYGISSGTRSWSFLLRCGLLDELLPGELGVEEIARHDGTGRLSGSVYPPTMSSSLVDRLSAVAGELSRFARWLTASGPDGDDVVQETLLRAFAAGDVPPGERAFRAWLFRVARNVHVDLRRAQAARERLVVLHGGRDELEDAQAPAVPLYGPIDRMDLERALLALPEGARAALVLTDVWAFDHEEVAAILDIPLGTVKSRVARARARLATLLAMYAPPQLESRKR